MSSDFTEEPWAKAPDVRSAFDRARADRSKEKPAKAPALKYELRPPSPLPFGLSRQPIATPPSRQERRAEIERTLRDVRALRREFQKTAQKGRSKAGFNRASPDDGHGR